MLLKRFANKDLNKGRVRQGQQDQRTGTRKNTEALPAFKHVTLYLVG